MAWSSIVGGIIGGAIGGPIGAGIGVAIGAAIDSDSESITVEDTQSTKSLNASLRYSSCVDGSQLFIDVPSIPSGSVILIRAINSSGNFRKAKISEYADDDGDFILSCTVAHGKASCFLPYGVISPKAGKLHLTLHGIKTNNNDEEEQYVFLGEDDFNIDWIKSKYYEVKLWRPLIGLCMHVARADGGLDGNEVRYIKNLMLSDIGISSEELNELKEIIKSEPVNSIDDLINELNLRFPYLETKTIISTLIDIAKSDGRADKNKVATVKIIAHKYGINEHQWNILAEDFELDIKENIHSYLETLGLPSDPTVSQIKAAYRKRISDIHPDKYQNLPAEIQKILHEKATEVTKAKDELLRYYSYA